jgi:hypothetical protein
LKQAEEKVEKFDISAVSHQVSKDQRKYQDEIQQSKNKEEMKHQANEQKLFLDGNLSINHF